MKKSRLILLLLLIFAACFWWSGGHTISDRTLATGKSLLSETMQTAPDSEKAADFISTAWEKTHRVFALKTAVANTLSTRNYIKLDQIGLPMQQAIVAIEDSRFYTHPGFDIEAIARAGLVNLQYGQIEEGASTISQQLIKNLFLSRDQSIGRKLEEILLAIDLELRYSKEEILELYLNTIYFGSGMYGIGDASVGYFGKLPNELTLSEAAMLAGLPNAPSLYSPYVDFQAAKRRQAIVLDTMAKNGYINPTIAEKTKQEPIRLAQ